MATINLYTIWQMLISEVNVQQGGQIRPEQDFQKWMNAISLELFREKIAAAEINQQNEDDLAPFLKHLNIVIKRANAQYGLMEYPADYSAFSNLTVLRQKDTSQFGMNNSYPVQEQGVCMQVTDPDYARMEANFAGSNLSELTINKVDNQKWSNCLSHDTKGPTFESPKASQYADGFHIAPAGISMVILDYYREPIPCVFGYTIGPDDNIIYDSNASTQLEWPASLTNEFLVRLCKKYGMHVRDSETYQMANENKKQLVPGN